MARASNQFWSIADASQTGLDLGTSTSDFTFSTWVNYDSLPASGEEYNLCFKWVGGSNNRSFYFYIVNASGTYKFGANLSSLGTSANYSAEQAITSPSTSTWYHYVVTYDASPNGTLKFYVNGAEATTANTAVTTIYNSSAAFNVNISSGFNGNFADTRVWQRLLDSSSISSLYSAPCAFDNGASLSAWWLWTDNGTDETANNNDLTNNNSATFAAEVPYSCSVFVPHSSFFM
jgi:hypothetical protein